MARLEAGEMAKLKTEIDEQGKAGPLSLPWRLTSAAVAVREGRTADAAHQLGDARALSQTTSNGSGVFGSCVGDRVFQDVCSEHVELADICHAQAVNKTTR